MLRLLRRRSGGALFPAHAVFVACATRPTDPIPAPLVLRAIRTLLLAVLVLGLSSAARVAAAAPDPAGATSPGGRMTAFTVDVSPQSGEMFGGVRRVSIAIPDGYRTRRVDGDATGPGAPAVEFLGESRMRGTTLATVRVGPGRVRLNIELEAAPPDPGDLHPRRIGSAGDVAFRQLLRAGVVNPGAIVDPAPASPRASRGQLQPTTFPGAATDLRYRPSLDGSDVSCVIITSDALTPQYQRLAEWRTRTGNYTVIRSVDWILATYPDGVDAADSIRRFIRDSVELWGVEWVLLGGDSDIIPARYGHTNYFGGEDIPADIYYQCLDGNWNANGNGVFGEGLLTPPVGANSGDNCDLDPDVWVGRIPLSTATGVQAVIDKLFRYERTPPIHRAYIPSMLCLAEMLQPINWEPGQLVLFDGAELGESTIANLPAGFRVTRMYENYQDPRWASICLPENKDAVVDSMNAGYEIVHHIGHGFRNNVSVGLGGKELDRSVAEGLTNRDEPFLWYGINCNSASFDFDCIAEYFLRNPNGGAFAYIGSTRFDFPGHSEDYTGLFYRNLFAGIPEVGKALALAKRPRIQEARYDGADRWTQFALLCLGDPMTAMRSRNPATLAVTHPASVVLGGNVAVTVQQGGVPLAGARVTLYRTGDLFVTGTTDVAGAVTLACPANDTGAISLTVTELNSVPYEGTVTLNAATLAHLKVTGLVVKDDVVGNNDGHLDPGETADLRFSVQNNGAQAASDVVLNYAPEGSALVVVTSTTDLGAIAAGASGATPVTQAIRVTVASSISRPTAVAGSLTLTWTGGSRVDPVSAYVGGVNLWLDAQTFVDDPGGAGSDGVVAANERVEVMPVIRNRGLSTARDVRVRLAGITPGVTLVDSVQALAGLTGGGVVTPASPLAFRVSDPALVGSIDLVIEADGIEVLRRAMDLTPPAAPGTPTSRPGPKSITLSWAGVTATDLRGYVVYRAASAAGPFERINPIASSPMAYYVDDGLAGFTTYYYQVAAQDLSGNVGPRSGVVGVTTSFATLLNFPLEREAGTPASPTLHDLDGDGDPEIIIGGEELYVIHSDGTEYFDGDRDSRTLGILTSTGRATFWGTPAVGDVDNDGILEIVAAGWKSGLLYVFGTEGAIEPGWPRRLATPDPGGVSYLWASPCLADIDGDGRLEIFIPGDRWLYGFHHDGTEIRDGDNNPATIGPFADLGGGFNYGTAAAADLDHDNIPEIVIGARVTRQLHAFKGNGTELAGFPKTLEGAIQSSPALADLDNDGELEIIVAVHQPRNKVEAINRFGVSPPGWPVGILVNQDLDASPTVGDINLDGHVDVVMMGGSGKVQAWRGDNGQPLFGPVDLAALESDQSFAARGTPTLGDITGDGKPDILIGTQSGTFYGIDSNGQVLPGFPLRAIDSIEGGALIWDVDGDGKNEILFASVDKNVYAFYTPGIFSAAALPWPMFRRDQTNSGSRIPSVPLPAEPTLASFTAGRTADGQVRLEWATPAPESRWVGWNVLRSDAGEAEPARLNPELLPIRGGVQAFEDPAVAAGQSYTYRIEGMDRTGEFVRFAALTFLVPDGGTMGRLLRQNMPNPFRTSTTVAYRVPGPNSSPSMARSGYPAGAAPLSTAPDPGTGSAVRITIFDLQGRSVRTLVSGVQGAGEYSVAWDARDDAGRMQPNGVYFCRLDVGAVTETRKMILTP